MLGTHDLWLFILSGLLLNITPGVDTLFILSHASSKGFRAGLIAALGIGGGCMVHIVAATLGVSALLATSAMAFTIVKSLGAMYLLYIGYTLLRSSKMTLHVNASLKREPLTNIFWQGFLTNLLNPKVALFFLAFLPQFVETDASSKALSMLFLGLVFNINGTLWNIFVAGMSTALVSKLNYHHILSLWFHRTIGALFITLGIKLFAEK